MAGNSFGKIFCLSSFGESHGAAIGGIVDGCPAGLELDTDLIRKELQRRRPGQSGITSSRMESDEFEILSGIENGKTLGTPIAFLIRNQDARPGDYNFLESAFRPSHADFTYHKKYGIHSRSGGGRSSARETVSRVFAGAIAKQFLGKYNIEIKAFVEQVGPEILRKKYEELDLRAIDDSPVRCPDKEASERMIRYIEKIKSDGDSTGGVIFCAVSGVPPGLGDPVFGKLQADLAKAVMSINAAHGFEYGSGFKGAGMLGSEHNDEFYPDSSGNIRTRTNNSGGIQGGISNGMDICFRVAFKPVSTIMKSQSSVDAGGREKTIEASGRHDPCVVPRAVPIIEAMTALVLADHLLMDRSSRL